MASIERQVVVDCPPEHVFDVLSRVERLPEFSEMTVAVRNGPGRPVQTGDRFDQVVKLAGREFETHWQVLEVLPADRLTVSGVSDHNGTATVTHHLAPAGGGTRVTFAVEYDPPYGLLGEIADKVLFERKNGDDAEHILARLKELCERSA